MIQSQKKIWRCFWNSLYVEDASHSRGSFEVMSICRLVYARRADVVDIFGFCCGIAQSQILYNKQFIIQGVKQDMHLQCHVEF
jgi:hypothetical protein